MGNKKKTTTFELVVNEDGDVTVVRKPWRTAGGNLRKMIVESDYLTNLLARTLKAARDANIDEAWELRGAFRNEVEDNRPSA